MHKGKTYIMFTVIVALAVSTMLIIILNNNVIEYSARDCAARPLKLSIHSGGIEHACRRR